MGSSRACVCALRVLGDIECPPAVRYAVASKANQRQRRWVFWPWVVQAETVLVHVCCRVWAASCSCSWCCHQAPFASCAAFPYDSASCFLGAHCQCMLPSVVGGGRNDEEAQRGEALDEGVQKLHRRKYRVTGLLFVKHSCMSEAFIHFAVAMRR